MAQTSSTGFDGAFVAIGGTSHDSSPWSRWCISRLINSMSWYIWVGCDRMCWTIFVFSWRLALNLKATRWGASFSSSWGAFCLGLGQIHRPKIEHSMIFLEHETSFFHLSPGTEKHNRIKLSIQQLWIPIHGSNWNGQKLHVTLNLSNFFPSLQV